ncbi:hypothetical protein BM528_02740 [Alteromonas sp. RW2A1]|uniref:hypothetical protein n=1 Tax=Alteromonas sp. RW2A1 TaxID=1917158 RepID=UPI0009039B16|nr:hypothetical protein [Alteromonas sp. RW2A1]APE04820.1 hypothetical protein BM528_02740 [Alteromonas sp. RW2A1]
MAIPKSFVESNLEKAKGSLFFGVPIEEMTRDELIACCVAGWQGQSDQRQEHARQLDVLSGMKRA